MTQTTPGICWVSRDPESLPGIAAKLLEEAGSYRVFALYGEMGAGKTTFIKALCRQLGVHEIVASPTFNIVNEYVTEKSEIIYHFDFYRIKSESEAYDLGYENYLYSGNYCFMEWPEKIASLLPERCAAVYITANGAERVITLSL